MELVGEDGFFVGFAVVVGVLVDEEHIVWFWVAGLPMWVAGHGGDPEAALVIKGNLRWVREVGEFFLRSKKLHLVSGC